MTTSDQPLDHAGSPAGPARRHDPGPRSAAERSPATLPAYFLVLLTANAVLHAVIALTGNTIGILAAVLLAVIALGCLAYVLTAGRGLRHVRYGVFVLHTLTFATVTVGFTMHALVLLALDSPTIAEPPGPLGGGWFGPTLPMTGIWGLGLLIHALGAVMSHGFEEGGA